MSNPPRQTPETPGTVGAVPDEKYQQCKAGECSEESKVLNILSKNIEHPTTQDERDRRVQFIVSLKQVQRRKRLCAEKRCRREVMVLVLIKIDRKTLFQEKNNNK